MERHWAKPGQPCFKSSTPQRKANAVPPRLLKTSLDWLVSGVFLHYSDARGKSGRVSVTCSSRLANACRCLRAGVRRDTVSRSIPSL